jgi:hypothetical protein
MRFLKRFSRSSRPAVPRRRADPPPGDARSTCLGTVYIEHFPAQFPENLLTDGGFRLDVAEAFAVGAWFAHHAADTLPHPLAGHLHQAQFRHLEDVGFRLVELSWPLPEREHLLPINLFFHVDEVDDDDTADVAQPQLVGNLLDRLQVGLEDGILQVVLAHITAGVDVNGGQRLGLFDDDVTTRLEPDLAAQSAADLHLQAEMVENRLIVFIKLDGVLDLRHEGGDELDNLVVFRLGINDDAIHVFTEDITHHLLGNVQVGVNQAGGMGRLVLLDNLFPKLGQVEHVRQQIVLALPLGNGADNEAAGRGPGPLDNLLQRSRSASFSMRREIPT